MMSSGMGSTTILHSSIFAVHMSLVGHQATKGRRLDRVRFASSSTLMDCWTGRSAGLSPLKPNCWVLLRQFARCRGGEAELFGRH
jgi:hypothetical protein